LAVFSVKTPVYIPRNLYSQKSDPNLVPSSAVKADAKKAHAEEDYLLFHPVYTAEELSSVKVNHRDAKGLSDLIALTAVRTLRWGFDKATGYKHDPDIVKHENGPNKVTVPTNMTEEQWLSRVVFLETVAGVPGMVGAMVRHMRSLRGMRRDKGWIHSLLEEAENERMHLLTFLALKKAGPMFRASVLVTQGVFFNLFFWSYLLSPRTCHRFVGFLEEEAVITYSRCLKDLDAGKLPKWTNMAAPDIAKGYWRLADNAKMRDVLLAVRADEANHRIVNHTFADLSKDAENPFVYHENQGLAERHIRTTRKMQS
jgi:hypothetical protein